MNNNYDVLFNNKQYTETLNEMNTFLKETANLIKQGYRIDVVNEKQKGKVVEFQDKFKQVAKDILNQKEQQAIQIKEKYNKPVANPEQEVIRRQDFQARLDLISNEEVLEDISELNADNVDLFTFQAYNKVLNSSRFSDSQRNSVMMKMSELKQIALYPYENDEAYNTAVNDYAFINSTGMAVTGTPFTEGEYGVEYKSVSDRYNDVFKTK